MIAEQAASLATHDGVVLEARLTAPAGPPGAIVVAHPHPLYGGDMHNPVVVRLVEVCGELGWATLRFNFRGVGASTGVRGDGRDERHDVQAALAYLASSVPAGTPLVLGGFSFGAAAVAQVAADRSAHPAPAGLLLVAPPLVMTGDEPVVALGGLGIPVLVVAGDRDEYCPPAALETLARRAPDIEIRTIGGADHFFSGKLYPLGQSVARWARRLEPGQPRGGGAAG